MNIPLHKITNWIGFAAVTAGLFGPDAYATGWCPTSIDNTISCSNCTRELTCHVFNKSLYITGSNVTFTGGEYGMFDSPGPSITVTGLSVTIRDMEIQGAGAQQNPNVPGILFNRQTNTTSISYLRNVLVSGSTGDGVLNQGRAPVVITDNSHIAFNGRMGVYANGLNNWYTDLLNSFAWGNSNGSGFYTEKPGSYVNGNFIEENSTGLFSTAGNMQVKNNRFHSNSGNGLMLINGSYNWVTGNLGSLNGIVDCYEQGQTNITHAGNSWTTWEGSTCLP